MNPQYNQHAPNFQAPPPLPPSNYNGNQLPPNVIHTFYFIYAVNETDETNLFDYLNEIFRVCRIKWLAYR